jgi:ApaG protein
MVSSVTEGVRVSVVSSFLPRKSSPERRRYVFAYRITIANESSQTVQLLRRHWMISDENGQVTEVHGEGVVGEQPVLGPGADYTYTSGAVLETPTGTMEGHYEMQVPDGELLRVAIPLFALGRPAAVH